jgi:hypothetical protein
MNEHSNIYNRVYMLPNRKVYILQCFNIFIKFSFVGEKLLIGRWIIGGWGPIKFVSLHYYNIVSFFYSITDIKKYVGGI